MNVTIEDPQILSLHNVTENDEGWYTCIAANSLGTSYSTAYLKVVEGSITLYEITIEALSYNGLIILL